MPRRFSSRNNQQEIHEGTFINVSRWIQQNRFSDTSPDHLVVTLGIAALSDVHLSAIVGVGLFLSWEFHSVCEVFRSVVL